MPRNPPPKKPQALSEPADLFSRARNIIQGQRQADYGDTLVNFAQIAAFWNAHLGLKLNDLITPADVGMMMISLKLARLSKSPEHYDSLLDIAGYAGCLEVLIGEEQAATPLPGVLSTISASSLTRVGDDHE